MIVMMRVRMRRKEKFSKGHPVVLIHTGSPLELEVSYTKVPPPFTGPPTMAALPKNTRLAETFPALPAHAIGKSRL